MKRPVDARHVRLSLFDWSGTRRWMKSALLTIRLPRRSFFLIEAKVRFDWKGGA